MHGEVGEPVQVLQTGVDPDFGGEVRVRELIHCSTHQRGFDSFLILQLLNTCIYDKQLHDRATY